MIYGYIKFIEMLLIKIEIRTNNVLQKVKDFR